MIKIGNNKYKNISPLDVTDVVDEGTFFQYAHQTLGTPFPRAKDIAGVRKQLKLFFEAYPTATFYTLTDVVRWAKHKNRHHNMMALISCYRWAYEDGYMHILERPTPDSDGMLNTLLEVVDDEKVRSAMRQAPDVETRDQIYDEYANRGPESVEANPLLEKLGVYAGEIVRFKQSLAHDWEFGTVLGAEGDRVFVHNKETFELLPWMVQSRSSRGEWSELVEP